MDELGAKLDGNREVGDAVRPDTAADAIARFNDEHRTSRASEFRRGGQPGRSRANDYDVIGHGSTSDRRRVRSRDGEIALAHTRAPWTTEWSNRRA
jgi:hypothetical protein